MVQRLWFGVFLCTLMNGTCSADEPLKLPLQLTVSAGQQARTDAIVTFPLAALKQNRQPLRLVETTGGKELPVTMQVDSQDGSLWWIASGETPIDARRTYRLEPGSATTAAEIVVRDSERAVETTFKSKPLLQYNKAHVEPPPGVDSKYGRSAHLHPIRTPNGAVVTDEFPPDHLHQSGIFYAFTRTEFAGRPVDFWNLAGGKGRVRFKALQNTTSGPVFGRFQVEHEHIDLTATDAPAGDGIRTGGKVALVESWDVRIWTAGFGSGYWLLDIQSQVKCASELPMRLPEYHYGGMAIRAARGWTPQHVTFLTSEGDERIKGNHTRPRWCDVRGLVDDQMAGVTLMTHPKNFRFPEPLRIHPTMPYMVYTPQFLGEFEIRPDMPHTSRYRFVIHDGDLSKEVLERLWREYSEPLIATAG